VTVSGKVTDKTTGKPVAGARVEYFPLYPNGATDVLDAGSSPRTEATTDKDGAYSVAVLAGPGMIGVTGPKRDGCMCAWITPKELEKVLKVPPSVEGFIEGYYLAVATGGQGWQGVWQQDYNALVLLNPGEQDKSLARDVELVFSEDRKGQVIDPDGKTLAGVRVWGLSPRRGIGETLKSTEFTVRGINPKAPRTLLFLHKDRNLGFVLKELPKEKSGPLTVALQPCGSVSGRFVDQDGKPVVGSRVSVSPKSWSCLDRLEVTTDKDGRFRLKGLVPGMEYKGLPGDNLSVESGKDKDLGNIKVEVER
jgi:hypothetical protein